MALIKNKLDQTWLDIKGFLEERIHEMHLENEHRLDDIQTARIRGKIEMARELLDQGVDENLQAVKPTEYI